MRIIQAAKRTQEARVTCPCCRSILGVEEDDLQVIGQNYKIRCPVCAELIGDFNKRAMFPWIMEEDDDREIQSRNAVRVN